MRRNIPDDYIDRVNVSCINRLPTILKLPSFC